MGAWPRGLKSVDNYSLAMAYLKNLPAAVSGSGGHDATLQAALACRRFHLTTSEMWTAMSWFNETLCRPAWSERELRHKIDSVADLAVKKALGHTGAPRRHVRAFVPPAPVVRKVDTRPICQRSEQDEQLWWARVALERGTTLEAWDEQ
jgi:hypothetical protein